MKIIPETCCVH